MGPSSELRAGSYWQELTHTPLWAGAHLGLPSPGDYRLPPSVRRGDAGLERGGSGMSLLSLHGEGRASRGWDFLEAAREGKPFPAQPVGQGPIPGAWGFPTVPLVPWQCDLATTSHSRGALWGTLPGQCPST